MVSIPRTSAIDILRQTAMLGIFALGSAVVIIAGGIDLSTGSMIAFAGTICATVMLLCDPAGMASGGVSTRGYRAGDWRAPCWSDFWSAACTPG